MSILRRLPLPGLRRRNGTGSDGQRGAAVLEYALVAVLVVVPITQVTDDLQEHQAERLEASGNRVGHPEELDNVGSTTTSTAPDNSTDETTPPHMATATLEGSTSQQGSQKWTAVVEVSVVDEHGDPLLDAVVDGTWMRTFAEDGSTDMLTAQCTTNGDGICALSLWNLRRVPYHDAVTHVDFTITGLSAAGVDDTAAVVGSTIQVVAP